MDSVQCHPNPPSKLKAIFSQMLRGLAADYLPYELPTLSLGEPPHQRPQRGVKFLLPPALIWDDSKDHPTSRARYRASLRLHCSPRSPSAGSFLLPSLVAQCYSQEQSLIDFLISNLHPRVCFLRTQPSTVNTLFLGLKDN